MDIDIVEFEDKKEDGYIPIQNRVRHNSYNSNINPLGRLSNPSLHSLSNKRNTTFKRRNGIL